MGTGGWSGGGGAIKRLQRSKNAAQESCVAVSASIADIASPVTLRVGPARTCEMMALCVNCGLDTEPEDAPVWRPVAAQTWSSYQLVTVGESVVLRVNYPCGKSDSSQWCQEAAAHSGVFPSEN